MPHINYFIYEGVRLITTTLLKTRVRNCSPPSQCMKKEGTMTTDIF